MAFVLVVAFGLTVLALLALTLFWRGRPNALSRAPANSLTALALAVPLLCVYLQLTLGGGWGILVYAPFYLLAYVLHGVAHYRVIARGSPTPSLAALALLSHLAFVGGFLLQWDYGDGPDWLYITVLLTGADGGSYAAQPPPWWPADEPTNLLVFVPAMVAWGLLLYRTRTGGD